MIDYILDAVGYIPSKAIEEKDIIDIACGSGGFLVRATRRLIARYAVNFGKATPKEALDNKRWSEVYERLTSKECEEIVNAIVMRIHGFDINPFAVTITEMNLLFQIVDLYYKAVKKNPSFFIPRFRIYETDSLEKQNPQIELIQPNGDVYKSIARDKEIVDQLKHKKYDFVVGNPPWLGKLKASKQVVPIYSDYVSAKGKFDIYILFIELGSKMLNRNGKLGYIVQNRFLKVGYAKQLRNYLANNVSLQQLLDFGDKKIFSDATNYPCIIILQNSAPASFNYAEFKPRAKELPTDKLLSLVKKHWDVENYNDDYFKSYTVMQKSLKDSGWSIGGIAVSDKGFLIEKLNGLKTLSDYTAKISQGVTCGGKGSDKIYYVKDSSIESANIEETLLKNVIRGKGIRKYSISAFAKKLLFPYDESGKPIDLKLYPFAAKYLNQFKDKLANRGLDGKIINEWHKEWFELWRAREPDDFKDRKIVCPRLAKYNRFAIDESGAYLSDSAVIIIPKNINIYFLLGLLNSRLLFAYISLISPFVQGKYYSYGQIYIERLPIKVPINRQEEVFAEKIITLVKEIIKQKKKDINTKNIETEIDDVVYQLYGITADKEIKIIEADCN